jgi:lambda family phage portal protein
MRQVATALGMSYNALGNDLEGVNYSSMRSGLLVEREYWRMIQDWWLARLLKPVYAEWMRMALLSGELVLDSRDPRKFIAVKFSARGWPWVDPLKDMQAGVMGVQNGLASRTQLLAETGQDYEEILNELAEEKRMADLAGVSVDGPEAAAAAAANDAEDDGSDGGTNRLKDVISNGGRS